MAEAPDSSAVGSALLANALESIPINDAGLSTDGTTCALPSSDASVEGQEAHHQAALGCLDRACNPMLNSAKLPFRSPEVVPVTSEVRTPCGPRAPTRTALYCHGTVYMINSYYRDVEGYGGESPVRLGQRAHECGHRVQELAGIMDASWEQHHEAGPESSRGYESLRRFELRATCYGGMFLAAVQGRGSIPTNSSTGRSPTPEREATTRPRAAPTTELPGTTACGRGRGSTATSRTSATPGWPGRKPSNEHLTATTRTGGSTSGTREGRA